MSNPTNAAEDFPRPMEAAHPIPSELSLILEWNDAEYFAADDLAILRPRTSEMAVVAEDTECGLPVSVRIVRGDSAQDIFEMSRPITCEEINLVVGQLEAEPHAIAIRLLELQRGAELARAHLEIIERRMGVLR